jgi:hypothetical protein
LFKRMARIAKVGKRMATGHATVSQ